MTSYDCIVIGGGIVGLSSAYQLKKKHNAKNVLLLEQFSMQHSRGSSHGGTRITRLAHTDEAHAILSETALKEYKKLERESGVELFNNCGVLWLGPTNDEEMQSVRKTMDIRGAEYALIRGEDLSVAFPGIHFDNNHCGILDKSGGILYAAKCLKVLQEQFVRMGGTINENEPVIDIRSGAIVTVTTTKERYTSRSLIISAGGWAGPMLAKLGLQLPLQPQLAMVCFWETSRPEMYQIDRFPAIFTSDNNGGECQLHGAPIEQYQNHLQMSLNYGPAANPDKRDQTEPDPRHRTVPSEYLQQHFVGFDKQPSIVEPCLYTVTPDRQFIIDRHPSYRNIVIGAGFSGAGFKHAPAIGLMLAGMALEKPSALGLDANTFSMKRLFKTSKCKSLRRGSVAL